MAKLEILVPDLDPPVFRFVNKMEAYVMLMPVHFEITNIVE